MSTPVMAEETHGRRFGPGEEELLLATLRTTEETTIVYPIEDPRQIILDNKFRTLEGECRLTWLAVRQISRALASGLGTYIADLTGYRRTPEIDQVEYFSHQDAADVLNATIRRRFRRDLVGMQAIRNSRTNVLEAIVGHGYRRLPNVDFVNSVKDVLASVRSPIRFHEATVVGRRATLIYLFETPVYQSEDNRLVAAYPGFCFNNSEVGDVAVRATSVIWFDPSGFALMPYNTSSRVAHTGRDFPRRFQRLLDRTLDRWREESIAADGVGPVIAGLRNISLGFTGDNEDADDYRFIQLTNQLRQKQMTQTTARRVLRRALFAAGREEVPLDQQRSERRRQWGGRSVLDLFVAILRETQENALHISSRERLEQIAYQILVGRFRPDTIQAR